MADHPDASTGRAEPPGPTLPYSPEAATRTADGFTTPATTEALPPAPPGYAVLGVLGRGGMGAVYKARQLALNRDVALKVILAGAHADPRQRDRFLREAEAAARVHHPHVVQVFEVGTWDGQPFLALEFCPGGTLADRLAGTPLPPAEAAGLVAKLARAVQAAHAQGVVHRDLKPANILLVNAECGPRNAEVENSSAFRSPHSAFDPKVADFGLAKLADSEAGVTATGSVFGTPSYMAPEQARGDTKTVGPAADVYALGAILYECLTGRPPFKAATAAETILQVLHREPAAVRSLNPIVPADLETIALKCLAKEPAKRYASAGELADDLDRWRRGEPIVARPVSAAEWAWKWARRHPAVTSLSLTLVLVLVTAVGVLGWQLRETDRARQGEARRADAEAAAHVEAQQAREAETLQVKATQTALDRAETNLALHRVLLAEQHWTAGNLAETGRLLDAVPPDQRAWEWFYLNRLRGAGGARRIHNGPVTVLRTGRDGRVLTATPFNPDPAARVWATTPAGEWKLVADIRTPAAAAALSPAGDLVATGKIDGTVELWSVETGKHLRPIGKMSREVGSLDFSPDGKLLAGACGAGYGFKDSGEVRVWEVESGTEVAHFPGAGMFVRFQPDGKRLAAARGEALSLWDTATWAEARVLPGRIDAVSGRPGLDFSADGHLLAVTGWTADRPRGPCLRVFDTETGAKTLEVSTPEPVRGVAIRPDGLQVATGTGPLGTLVVVWDARTGREVARLRGPTAPVTGVAFRPDGKTVYAIAEDGPLREWDPQAGPSVTTRAKGLPDQVLGHAIAFNRTITRAAFANVFKDHEIVVWDPTTGEVVHRLRGHRSHIYSLAFSADDRRLVSAGDDKTVRVWDLATGHLVREYTGHTFPIWAAAIAPDGTWVASGAEGVPEVRVWDADTGADRAGFRGEPPQWGLRVAIRPDGRRVASAGVHGVLELWDPADGSETWSVRLGSGEPTAVAFSPDGTLVAVTTAQRVTCVDVDTGRVLYANRSPELDVGAAVTFTPDGRRLVTAGAGVIRLWEARTGQEVLALKWDVKAGLVGTVAADAGRIVLGLRNCRAVIWDTRAESSR